VIRVFYGAGPLLTERVVGWCRRSFPVAAERSRWPAACSAARHAPFLAMTVLLL
jgi:hypothetical protein